MSTPTKAEQSYAQVWTGHLGRAIQAPPSLPTAEDRRGRDAVSIHLRDALEETALRAGWPRNWIAVVFMSGTCTQFLLVCFAQDNGAESSDTNSIHKGRSPDDGTLEEQRAWWNSSSPEYKWRGLNYDAGYANAYNIAPDLRAAPRGGSVEPFATAALRPYRE